MEKAIFAKRKLNRNRLQVYGFAQENRQYVYTAELLDGQFCLYVFVASGGELEFLWQKFPDNAVWRCKDTGKWYGALLRLSARKLGLDSDEAIEIIDLRTEPDQMSGHIDNRIYFPGYHMNKKH